MMEKEIHPIIKYIGYWKEHRNDSNKKNAFAVNRYIFSDIVNMLSDCEDIAYISIGETQDCIEYNKYDEYGHYLENSDNVLNIDFDDISEDIEVENYHFKTITDEQAKQIYDFILNHSDYHIICHCRAGKSRSQGVIRAVFDMFPNRYAECYINKINPCATPNYEVVAKIKRYSYGKD